MSVGKHDSKPKSGCSHTSNSVTCPDGVILPTLWGRAFWSFTKDSVNQKLPSDACVMCSGLLPAVGTLNCFSIPTGAACAAESVAPSTTASAATDATASAIRRRADGRLRISIRPPLWGSAPSTRPLLVSGPLPRPYTGRCQPLCTRRGRSADGLGEGSCNSLRELLRILTPRSSVHKGKEKGRGYSLWCGMVPREASTTSPKRVRIRRARGHHPAMLLRPERPHPPANAG